MDTSNKTLVGVFVAVGLVLVTIALFMIGDRRQLFSESIGLYAEFDEISGLQVGAPVRVSGGEAGEVEDIQVPPGPEAKFRIQFRVVDKYQGVLRSDSVATILTDGLVGNKFLEVGAGSGQGQTVKDGDTIQSKEPFDISDVMQDVRNTVTKVNQTIDDVQDDLRKTLQGATDVVNHTDDLIEAASDDVQGFIASSRRIADNTDRVIDRINRGEGTVGKLFTDDKIYQNLRSTTDSIEVSAKKIKDTSTHVEAMVAEVKQRGIIEDFKQTTENIKETTARARQAIEDFKPQKGRGLADELRQTMTAANEAMVDFSENAEALKHNFFFRGFFKNRRFFDLDEISIEGYKAGREAPGWPIARSYLPASELFLVNLDGSEILSDEGRKAIDRAMGGMIEKARTHAIMIEGYAAQGSESEQFTRSHQRAQLVRQYLIENFFLRPNYVGIMSMGKVESKAGNGTFGEGVGVVLFANEPPDKNNKARGPQGEVP